MGGIRSRLCNQASLSVAAAGLAPDEGYIDTPLPFLAVGGGMWEVVNGF